MFVGEEWFVRFQKKSIPTPWKFLGGGGLKIQNMKKNWNIFGGGERGAKQKPSVGGYGYFLELHSV